MAGFTITLKRALDFEPNIGLESYPIWSEGYRAGLNQKIKDHFWNREIGQESIEMFKLALHRKMNEIMPLYNQQYLASQIQFDPLKTVHMSNITDTTGTDASTGNSTTGSTSDAKSRAIGSDFPQMILSENGDYASNGQDSTANTTATGTGEETRTGNQTGHADNEMSGYSGSPAMLIYEYRQTLVNIDMMVINDLENLFMLVWSSGDEFTNPRGSYFGYFGFPF